MKKQILFLTILTLIINSCSNNTRIAKPEQIGQQVFDILKKMGKMTIEEYKSHFLTIEEIRELAQNEEMGMNDKAKNQLTSLSKNDYNSYLEREYNQVKKDAIENEINLEEITYLDFIYKTKEEDGVEVIKGTTYFKYNGETYEIESSSINTKKEYLLTEIEDLKKK